MLRSHGRDEGAGTESGKYQPIWVRGLGQAVSLLYAVGMTRKVLLAVVGPNRSLRDPGHSMISAVEAMYFARCQSVTLCLGSVVSKIIIDFVG